LRRRRLGLRRSFGCRQVEVVVQLGKRVTTIRIKLVVVLVIDSILTALVLIVTVLIIAVLHAGL
jgi:hypothetical protein